MGRVHPEVRMRRERNFGGWGLRAWGAFCLVFVAGLCQGPSAYAAFITTVAPGDASGVSADGTVVVGTTAESPGQAVAYRWTAAGGLVKLGQSPTPGANPFSLAGA